jgi:RHS repeat-associated protein
VGVTENGSISAVCFGDCLQSQGDLGTDKLFTGQNLDNSGLYYYGARYYDPTIGKFISADAIVQNPYNPQSLNRYSYCLNNPLRYTDPTGHLTMEEYYAGMTMYGIAPEEVNLVPVTTSTPTIISTTLYSTGMIQYGITPSTNPIDVSTASYPSISNSTQLVVPSSYVERDTITKLADTGVATGIMAGESLLQKILTNIGLKDVARFAPAIGPISSVLFLQGDTNPDIIMQDRTIDDFHEHPENWEKTGEAPPEPATGRRFKGGTSIEETFQNKDGQTLERHRIYNKNGKVVHEHLRVQN